MKPYSKTGMRLFFIFAQSNRNGQRSTEQFYPASGKNLRVFTSFLCKGGGDDGRGPKSGKLVE